MKIGIDLDGTILTCKEKQMSLLNAKLKPYNLKLDLELIWNLKRTGLNNKDILDNLIKDQNIVYKICKSWILEIESIHWLYYDKIIKGSIEKIDKWIMDGHTVHLISARNNKLSAYNQLFFNRINVKFSTIQFVNPLIKNAKSIIFKELDLDCYIGDTENDVLSANIAGIKSFSVLSGMRDLDYFNKINVTDTYNTIVDIII